MTQNLCWRENIKPDRNIEDGRHIGKADDAWIKDRKRLKMINRYHNFDSLRFVSSIILPRILALKLRGFVES